MYNWRKMTNKMRQDVLRLRKTNRQPWHSPPHRMGDEKQYHITAACYEHKPIIGNNETRIAEFETSILKLLEDDNCVVYAWVILPNHYHVLIKSEDVLDLLENIGQVHGRTSFHWNGEENKRGRKVWCGALENVIKSKRHYWATINYIHHNPVHHRYVKRWQDWPFSSASLYLRQVGRMKAKEIWNEYPVLDYGKDWDPPEL